jgi:hypothetical protein
VSVPVRSNQLKEELHYCFNCGQIYVVKFQCLGLVVLDFIE